MIRGATGRACVGRADDRQGRKIDPPVGDVGGENRAVGQRDPCCAVTGKLRLEHEAEGSRERRGFGPAGELDETARKLAQRPGWGLEARGWGLEAGSSG